MASVLDYVIESLEDFVLLAYDSPFRATLVVLLIASLASSNFWASWIGRLQQSESLNVASNNDAIQEANGVNRPPRSSSNIQTSRGNLGNYNTRPNGGRTSSSSSASTGPKRPFRELDGPIGFPISPSHLFLNPTGRTVVGPPLDGSGSVSFYPSTSPRYRG